MTLTHRQPRHLAPPVSLQAAPARSCLTDPTLTTCISSFSRPLPSPDPARLSDHPADRGSLYQTARSRRRPFRRSEARLCPVPALPLTHRQPRHPAPRVSSRPPLLIRSDRPDTICIRFKLSRPLPSRFSASPLVLGNQVPGCSQRLPLAHCQPFKFPWCRTVISRSSSTASRRRPLLRDVLQRCITDTPPRT